MKEFTLTFNEEEYLVLAKMMSIGHWIMCADEGYHDFDTVNKLLNDVCKKGFYEFPESGYFREMGELNYIPYGVTAEVEEETTTLTDLAEMDAMNEDLPIALAARDFEEKYGKLGDEEILMNAELLAEITAIQKMYNDEIAKYGITHLRLEKN